MNTLNAMTAVLAISVLSANVYAERGNGFYVGLKTGVIEPDTNGYDLDDDNPIVIQGGYDFSGFAAQAEYYSFDSDIDNELFSADFSVLGLYGAFRTSGFAYLMGKAGLVIGEVEIGGYDESDTTFSYGVGAGLNFDDFIFAEVEYTIIEIDEVDLDFFSISANLKF